MILVSFLRVLLFEHLRRMKSACWWSLFRDSKQDSICIELFFFCQNIVIKSANYASVLVDYLFHALNKQNQYFTQNYKFAQFIIAILFVTQDGSFQIRCYPAAVWATTTKSKEENKAFWKLFGYIQGKNDKGLQWNLVCAYTVTYDKKYNWALYLNIQSLNLIDAHVYLFC